VTRSAGRVVYLDASAIVKLVVREAETDALAQFLGSADCVSSEVAAVEVPRAAFLKTGDARTIAHAERIIRGFFLVVLDAGLRRQAATARPAGLRTLDAIHLVSAMHVSSRTEAAVIYDVRLAEAARAVQLAVQAPGLNAA